MHIGTSFSLFFVCLDGVYRPTQEFFTHMETSPLPVKGCKFWPILGTHGHWAVTCHTYSDTGLQFIMVISDECDTRTCCRAFGSGVVTTCFYDLGLSRPGIEPWSPAHEVNALPLRHRGGGTSFRGEFLWMQNLIIKVQMPWFYRNLILSVLGKFFKCTDKKSFCAQCI